MREAGFSAVLSFIFSGLGQIYNGEIKKGFIIMTFSLIGIILLLIGAIIIGYFLLTDLLSFKGAILGSILFIIGLGGTGAFGIYSIWDAYKRGEESKKIQS